jgi:AraC-like DNA-binding protein
VEDLRRELALRYLAERRMAIAEIAFLLGFSEASAFHRAFRRWSGRTPADYRQS